MSLPCNFTFKRARGMESQKFTKINVIDFPWAQNYALGADRQPSKAAVSPHCIQLALVEANLHRFKIKMLCSVLCNSTSLICLSFIQYICAECSQLVIFSTWYSSTGTGTTNSTWEDHPRLEVTLACSPQLWSSSQQWPTLYTSRFNFRFQQIY